MGYVPQDSEHIGYLKNVSFKTKKHTEWRLDLLPYEWFESEIPPSRKILVLWLDDSSFYGNPLEKLSDLADALNPKTYNKKPPLTLKILGPAGSTNLRSIVKEVKAASLDDEQKNVLRNVEIFSWAATVDPEKLLSGKDRPNKDKVNLSRYIENKCMIGKEKTLSFYRFPMRCLT